MKYFVVTPPYNRHELSTFTPPEYGADVVEVEAETKAEAKVKGLRELRRTGSWWVQDMETDLRNPFNGLEVHEAE